jgi:hypothetical protein
MIMNATTALTGLNILLIAGLLFVYVRNLIKIRSNFTVGLIIFAGLFLVQNAVSFYFFITMMPYYAHGLEVHVFVLTLLQTVAFGIMSYFTWR